MDKPNTSSPNVRGSSDEGRTRSTGELLQRLGATNASEVKVEEIVPPAGNATLEVHPDTVERLNWKPECYAVSRDGALRVGISRAEADALLAAGAVSSR